MRAVRIIGAAQAISASASNVTTALADISANTKNDARYYLLGTSTVAAGGIFHFRFGDSGVTATTSDTVAHSQTTLPIIKANPGDTHIAVITPSGATVVTVTPVLLED